MYFAGKVKENECKGCKLCIFSCPEPNVISFERKGKIVKIDVRCCKGCGLCVEVCPTKAIDIIQIT
ncbi:MAG: 4Fe-4S binding protein [Actinobacteria bacterium]|nr:4Fe-4S binding protein [Actinomycetota bacterium]